jgi:putative N6-adenine-specific DNA methylase
MTSARRCPLRSLEYVTLRIKDAVCDHFRERARRRPSVETARPDIRIAAFLDEHRATFYLDTSGEALFKRGWRQMTGEAPLRENLAAGLLRLAQWTPGQPLLDPMCGSGTILLEAVQWARGVAPGLGRTFAVERLRAFDRVAWQSAVAAAEARQHARPSDVRLFGSDRDPVSLQAARANLQAVGALQAVRLDTQDVVNIKPPATSGIIVTNPPYGVRTGHADDLAAFYPNLGDVLKQRFAGWRAYVFTADQRLPGLIGLKPSRRIPLFNGSLECRLYEFAVVSGQYRKQERTG